MQLHPEPARGVDAEAGFPAAAAGQQGALGGAAPAAAGAAAARERGAQAAALGRAAEADRGAEGAEAKAGGGNWPGPSWFWVEQQDFWWQVPRDCSQPGLRSRPDLSSQ